MAHQSSNEITKYIAQSAEKYYIYLSERDKGNEKVKVCPQRTDEYIFVLSFESKIQDFGFVTQILFDGKDVAIENFKVLFASHYYAEIAVRESQLNWFLLSKEITLVVDFKRFVWNVRQAFVSNPPLYLPAMTPTISFDKTAFEDINFSSQQLEAINNIFSSPMSYIWGGAGSGKTRYVLAYSALTYLFSRQSILIAAPTNIALENAMSAIILAADKYGIDRKLIFRAGVPSPEFAKEFPECCRNAALEKEIRALTEKYNKLREFIMKCENLEIMKEISSFINIIEYSEEEIRRIQLLLEDAVLKRKLYITRIDEELKTQQATNAMIEVYTVKKRSLFYKLKKGLNISSEIDAALARHTQNLADINARIIGLQAALNKYDSEITKNKELIDALGTDIKYSKISIKKLMESLSDKNFEEIDYNRLKIQISEYTNKCEYFFDGISKQYPTLNFEDVEAIKNEAQQIAIEINNKLILQEERKDKVLIYGSTLDNLSTNAEYNFNHIFLDEACYSCMAKTALLFKYNCPITFLGDHMQLPPVAEFNDNELKEKDLSSMFLFAQNGIHTCELFNGNFEKLCSNYLDGDIYVPDTLSLSNLLHTHRFGRNLCKTLDKYVYKSGFESALDFETKIHIIDAPKSTPSVEKRENYDEAVAIRKYLLKNNLEDYAILSPYTNQVRVLKSELRDISTENILTIHKSQGQEWDTVIISVSDTDNKYFTNVHNNVSKGKQLLNTAISRAKKELIIVCDVSYWRQLDDQLITELIEISDK